MADGNGVGPDANFGDQETHDGLPLGDVERLAVRAQAGTEVGERLREPQIAGLIDGRRLEGLDLGGDRLLL